MFLSHNCFMLLHFWLKYNKDTSAVDNKWIESKTQLQCTLTQQSIPLKINAWQTLRLPKQTEVQKCSVSSEEVAAFKWVHLLFAFSIYYNLIITKETSRCGKYFKRLTFVSVDCYQFRWLLLSSFGIFVSSRGIHIDTFLQTDNYLNVIRNELFTHHLCNGFVWFSSCFWYKINAKNYIQ